MRLAATASGWRAGSLLAGIEAHVIHSASVAVSRERKRAKTDRLDAAMLMRVFLGWLRGERGHCGMVAIPTMEEERTRVACAANRRCGSRGRMVVPAASTSRPAAHQTNYQIVSDICPVWS